MLNKKKGRRDAPKNSNVSPERANQKENPKEAASLAAALGKGLVDKVDKRSTPYPDVEMPTGSRQDKPVGAPNAAALDCFNRINCDSWKNIPIPLVEAIETFKK